MMKELESDFLLLLKENLDISHFLYFPYTVLTSVVREHLDSFLKDQAFKRIDEWEKGGEFIVYRDEYLNITMDTDSQKQTIISSMHDYFLEKEDYEKCARIQKLKQTLKL